MYHSKNEKEIYGNSKKHGQYLLLLSAFFTKKWSLYMSRINSMLYEGSKWKKNVEKWK